MQRCIRAGMHFPSWDCHLLRCCVFSSEGGWATRTQAHQSIRLSVALAAQLRRRAWQMMVTILLLLPFSYGTESGDNPAKEVMNSRHHELNAGMFYRGRVQFARLGQLPLALLARRSHLP